MRLDAWKHYICAAALAAAPLALTSVSAATPAEVVIGMQVVDPSGGAVGTVSGNAAVRQCGAVAYSIGQILGTQPGQILKNRF